MKNVAGNYYDKHHSKNPIVKFLMRRFHRDLFSAIRRTRARRILDVGCGEGYTTNLVNKKFPKAQIEGSDLEQSIIRKANKCHPHIKFKSESIYDLKRKDAAFDLVIANEVLEHIDKPEKGLDEIKRVAKRFCIVSVPNEPYWRMANMARLRYLRDWGNTPGHIQHWTKRGFEKLLKKKFRRVKVRNSLLWNIALCEK